MVRRDGSSVLRREVGSEGISVGYFLPRGGGGGGGGCCAERRFAEIDVLDSETSVEIRGVMSTDVTEVSESFRLGRGIGGFTDCCWSEGWGGNSLRNDEDRSTR